MLKGLATLLIPPLVLLFAIGCSSKKEDKPIPEIPQDSLKDIPGKSAVSSKPLPPSQ